MGEESEGSIRSLLQSDIASLRPIVTEILERVGFVDSMIRRLAHRDSDTRREAAATLATVGTTPAFRGLVRAAQDPDEGVRIEVTKALERLETGGDILNALREDPDRRVRKYTHWALQRIEAKSLSSEDTDGA
jgi:HEAT repeat protein